MKAKRILILDREERSEIINIFRDLAKTKKDGSFDKVLFPRIKNLEPSNLDMKDFINVNPMNELSPDLIFPVDYTNDPSHRDREGIIY